MGKTVQERAGEKIDGRKELQCDDPTGFGSQVAFSILDNFFFFLIPTPAPLTCTAAQSKGYNFQNR